MTCNFRVGQKVVRFRGSEGQIKIGTVLTVRAVQTCMRSDWQVHTGLLFEEIRSHPVETTVGAFEPDFRHDNFRPVVQRKTDISIFKALLTPSKEKVETAS